MTQSAARIELAPGYMISQVILGFWQLSGGHGAVDEEQAHCDIRRMLEAGFTTFDCADIYTGVEELLGRFKNRHRELLQRGELPCPEIHTKYVPDLEALPVLNRAYTEAVIDRSLRRLRVDCLDLVQFHWWDFDVPGYVEAVGHLAEAKEAGKIRNIGVTNFDAPHLRELLEAGMPVVCNQVQYSILDQRPRGDMVSLAEEYGFRLLCYGTVAGGFLTERYVGHPAPEAPLENRSLTKYALIIDEFGGWELFQELLRALQRVGERHGLGIAETAIKYILRKPSVAGVIAGTRHGGHLDRLKRIGGFDLHHEDLKEIDSVVSRASGPVGPVFGLERDREGAHGSIMKYNLNRIDRPDHE
jgi:aryl-alcohol dehydrogenase-like predicted oxidoreductase